MAKVLQFRVILIGTNPLIWRQFKVTDDYRFDRFHQVIQLTMGWFNGHLHEFTINNKRIGMLFDDGFDMEQPQDENTTFLKDFSLNIGDTIHYLYDFGDSWEHIIELEAITEEELLNPICLDGAMACPKEDCGGIPGYFDMVGILKNPQHPEYKEMRAWAGRSYQPDKFPKTNINKELTKFGKFHRANPNKLSTPWHQVEAPSSQQHIDGNNIEDFLKSLVGNTQGGFTVSSTSIDPALDGLSSFDMQMILHQTFEASSPIGFKKNIPNTALEKMPLLQLIIAFLEKLENVGELKLTTKGNLPRKWVHELYGLGFIKSKHIEDGITKLNKEEDWSHIHFTKLICSLVGITKKRNNKLSLTSKGKKMLKASSKEVLFKEILLTNIQKFNWGYFDGYPDQVGVQRNFGYTLYLLLQYGKEERLLSFYADKVIQAFPNSIYQFTGKWRTPQEQFLSCYSIRTFSRFLCNYGFIDYKERERYDTSKISILVQPLFNEIFEIKPDFKQN